MGFPLNLRLFFAIDFSPGVKDQLYNKAVEVSGGSGLRITPSENLHVSLKFLGDTGEKLVPEIVENTGFLSSVAGADIRFTNFGFFFRDRIPSIFFLNSEVPEELVDTVRQLEETLQKFGFAREKREFVPHLTLCRIKRFPGKEFLDKIKSAEPVDLLAKIENAVLFKSELRNTGAVYTALKKY